MFVTSLTFSTMTIPTTLRITSIVLVVQVVLVPPVLPSRSSLLKVSIILPSRELKLTSDIDSKQARDLVNVLREAKQQIDPKLEEMSRYGGGGGGGRGYGGRGGGRGGRGRGGYGGGGGGGRW
jgi:uncharacterized membrane protein YgcG